MWQKPTPETSGHSCRDNNNSHSICDFRNKTMYIKYFENKFTAIESYQEIIWDFKRKDDFPGGIYRAGTRV